MSIDKAFVTGLKKADEEIVKAFCESGAVNFVDNNTPLHYAVINKAGPDIVGLLISYGANVNAQNLDTPLHYACWIRAGSVVIKSLLFSGADITLKNNETPVEAAIDGETKDMMKLFSLLIQDMIILYESGEMIDLTIQCKGGTVEAHKLVIEMRGKNCFTLNEFLEFCMEYSQEEVKQLLRFLYTGIHSFSTKILTEFQQKLKFTKIGKKSLHQDFLRLYNDEETKDFSIIVGDYQIKTHKLILFARSEIYRAMFSFVNDPSPFVHDYSGKSKEAVSAFIRFLYTDSLEKDLSLQVVDELEDAADYYQLRSNVLFQHQLRKLREKFDQEK
ncbi:pep-cterm sorting domain-containing protein [Anaeramoeba ignava]|uniref:Pep-cterm sorting domain-containing protein n=1 Tax=Anaeramoeba ignava TaxID=1746090 RepID=A0A9Q0RBR6_ANAIG|nr:pep-cterm sorting domain-containing protein [Anaeramoeba ignava]